MPSNTGGTTALPNHVCIVVKDIQKTMEFLSSLLGIKPWELVESTQGKDVVTVGDPFTIKLAAANWGALGPVALELIQPVKGNSVWAQFLQAKGEGIHHIAYGAPNFDKEVSKLKKDGGTLIASGIFGGKRWAYFDTQPGGTVLEIMEQN